VKQSLLAEFKRIEDPATAKKHGFSGPFWEVEYDFTLSAPCPTKAKERA
jgi:hypothetical protein